jgi:hypothetical protein
MASKIASSFILLASMIFLSGANAQEWGGPGPFHPHGNYFCNGQFYGGYSSAPGGSLPMTLSTDAYGNLQVSTLGTDGRYYYGQGTCNLQGWGSNQQAFVNFNLNMGSYYIPYSGTIIWQGQFIFQGRQMIANGNAFYFSR